MIKAFGTPMLNGLLAHVAIACAVVDIATIEQQNEALYEPLKALAETDHFSKLKMSFNEKCPRAVEKCSALSCAVKEMGLAGESGVIDLLKTREAFSKQSSGGPEVWRDLYAHVEGNEQLRRITSGLHFSVSTHIAAFYTKVLDGFISNPRLFQKMFRDEYKENFLHLYTVLRAGVAGLANNTSTDIPDGARALGASIIEHNEKTASEQGGRPARRSGKAARHVNIEGIHVDPQSVSIISDMIKSVACLGCQKCRLWGTIQLRGLRAAVKSLNGMALTRLDAICLVNAFRRVSETTRQSRRLESARFPAAWLILVYYYEIVLVSTTVALLALTIYKTRKNKAIQ